jgi:phage terminase large subunit-like protein
MTLKEIIEDAATVVTSAPTDANRMHLARSFLQTVARKYAGTSMGRQELDGEMLMDAEGALWTWATLDTARRPRSVEPDRIVVAVDPPVTSGTSSDECGIIVAGAARQGPPQDWSALVIEDASVQGASPQVWAERAVAAFHRHKADRLVAEVNQGGEMVATIVKSIDPMIPFRAVRATRSKVVRAEPVAALYEQGRVSHGGSFPELEAQMAAMTGRGYAGKGSPDRVDALVWAITDLMIDAAAKYSRPGIRGLI